MNFLDILIGFIPILYVIVFFVIIVYLINTFRRIAVALEQMANAQTALSDSLARLEAQRLTQPTPDAEA